MREQGDGERRNFVYEKPCRTKVRRSTKSTRVSIAFKHEKKSGGCPFWMKICGQHRRTARLTVPQPEKGLFLVHSHGRCFSWSANVKVTCEVGKVTRPWPQYSSTAKNSFSLSKAGQLKIERRMHAIFDIQVRYNCWTPWLARKPRICTRRSSDVECWRKVEWWARRDSSFLLR